MNALEGDGNCTRPKLGLKSYFEMQIVDFLLDLGQRCQNCYLVILYVVYVFIHSFIHLGLDETNN